MNREIMIEIKNVKKKYHLGQITRTTLQHELQTWWALKRGKEDPNQKIGAKARNFNEVFYALKGINLTFYKGETVGIIGENGAGKSTLLKLLSRVTAPTEGEIMLNGRVTSMLEVGTGFDAELTGRENIYMNGAILGMSKAEIDNKIEQIIEFSELREFIDTPVKRYSSGMYTKLGFSVASHLDSEIIIMDEVLAVGDVSFQNKCISKMRAAAAEEERTVLYVSHNMDQIRQLCERCVVLKQGEVVFDGTTDKAIEYYLNQYVKEESKKDYTNEERPRWLMTDCLRVTSAEYINHDSIFFHAGEKMNVRIHLEAKDDIKDLSLRVEVSNVGLSKVGTYLLFNICDCEKGEKFSVDFEFDLSNLVDASYNAYYVFFTKDQYGNQVAVDWIRGLPFTCIDSKTAKQVQWDSRNWSFIHLDGAKVTKVNPK